MKLSDEAEQQIDGAFKTAFRGKSGETVEKYIRKLTLESALMPGVSANEVLHREGARWLAAIILERVNRGRHPNDYITKRDNGGSGRVEEYFSGRDTEPRGKPNSLRPGRRSNP